VIGHGRGGIAKKQADAIQSSQYPCWRVATPSPSDIAAREDAEQIALLLAGTDLAAAVRMAEEQAVATLGLRREGALTAVSP